MLPGIEPNDGAPARGGIGRSTVDGVPVFWTPEHPRFMGTLVFRVGRADEPIARGGLCHMVEHLVLHGLGPDPRYAYNGMVGPLCTVFQAMGTPAELEAFFAHVCGALRSLPLDRVENEARVLRTEAAQRKRVLFEHFCQLRYGVRDLGSIGYREFILDRPDPDAVAGWAAEHFTSGNAAAWFSGPVPAGLRLDLPTGPRRPPTEPPTIPRLKLPAWVTGPPGGVSISLVAPRNDWLAIPAAIAARRMLKVLRHDRGLTYGVQMDYHPLSRDTAHTVIAATSLDAQGQAVEAGMLGLLRDMAAEGPTEAELADMVEQYERGNQDPDAVLNELGSWTINELFGHPNRSHAQLTEELRSLTPALVAKRLRDALATSLLMLPPRVPCTDPAFHEYAVPMHERVKGSVHRSVKTPFPWSRNRLDLVVGDEGLSMVYASGDHVTLHYKDVAMACEHRDGSIELLNHFGITLAIEAAAWREGSRALGRIRSSVPADRYVRLAD